MKKLGLFFLQIILILFALLTFDYFNVPFLSMDVAQSTKVCFVPGDDCEEMIAHEIDQAKDYVDVQAYHLTNERITLALMLAEQRGVKVRIILDKAAENEALPFLNEGISVWIDYKKAIAHNKVLIIDDKEYGTGSFNFSEAAQHRNVENYNIIPSRINTKKYEDNFMKRLNQSRAVQ